MIVKAFGIAKETGLSLKEVLQQKKFSGLVGTYQYQKDKSLSLGETSLVCINNGEFVSEATGGRRG